MQTSFSYQNVLKALGLVLSLILRAGCVLAPLTVAATYLILPWQVSFVLYAIAMGLAVSFWERHLGILIGSGLAAMFLSFAFAHTFDAIKLLGLAIVLGLCCGPIPLKYLQGHVGAFVRFRVIRTVAAFGCAFGALILPIKGSGNCPGGGGAILQAPIRLSVISYVIILGLFVCDLLFLEMVKDRWGPAED